jgi:hypothetical protein
MPFVFIWTVVLAIPLIMSTGIIGLEQYLGYYFPHLSYWPMHLIAASYSDFHPGLAFRYPHGAFGGGFVAALGAAC